MKPKLEVIDNETEFKIRLVLGEEVSPWFKHYSSVHTHRFANGELWGVATQYYEGVLPTETPFLITT